MGVFVTSGWLLLKMVLNSSVFKNMYDIFGKKHNVYLGGEEGIKLTQMSN